MTAQIFPVLQSFEKDQTKVNFTINQLSKGLTDASNALSIWAPPLPNSISNTMLAQMPAHTFKGNNTGSTANALDLSIAQMQAELLGFAIYRTVGTADQTGINALFASNKTVWLPDPNYSISGAINIPSGGRLVGMGSGATVITGTAGAAGISIPNQEACTIEDLKLTGTMTTAVTVTGSNEFLMRRVWIEGTSITNGVVFSGLPYYARIYDSKINQVSSKAISGTGTAVSAFLDLLNLNIGGNGHTVNGINTTNIGLNITNCNILSTTGDAIVASSTSTPSQPFTMYASQADSCGGNGFNLTNFGSVVIDTSWASSNTLSGLVLTGCSNITISDNRVHYNQRHGMSLSNCDDGEITGNHIVNNGNAAAATYQGMNFVSGCMHWAIAGNLARNGAVGPAGQQSFAIATDGTCQFFNIGANMFDANVAGPYSIAAGGVLIQIINSTTQVPGAALPPAAPCTGSQIEVWDQNNANLAWGSVPTAGGLNNVLFRSNGVAWHLIGA